MILGLTFLFCTAALLRAEISVEIDLQEQRAYLLQNGRPVLASPISSGRYGHLTKTGSFTVLEKERSHYSSMYGKIVDANGNTVVADADADMQVPRGGKFIPAPMHYFMRFNGGDGLHAGYLPGYPASHGCVRMPERYAIEFFNAVQVGTPVTVFGRTPVNRYYSSQPQQPGDQAHDADHHRQRGREAGVPGGIASRHRADHRGRHERGRGLRPDRQEP